MRIVAEYLVCEIVNWEKEEKEEKAKGEAKGEAGL